MSVEYNNPENMEQRKNVVPLTTEEMNRLATVFTVAFAQKPTLEDLAQRLIFDYENLDHMRQTYPKWISFNDSFPEYKTDVLCLLPDGTIIVDFIYSEQEYLQYTHWQPLPPKP